MSIFFKEKAMLDKMVEQTKKKEGVLLKTAKDIVEVSF